nr:MAG TPA: hypothetical protein [Caudoviricetes sp.]
MEARQPYQKHHRRGVFGFLHHPGKLAGRHSQQHQRHRYGDSHHLQRQYQNRQRQQELHRQGGVRRCAQLYRHYLYPGGWGRARRLGNLRPD